MWCCWQALLVLLSPFTLKFRIFVSLIITFWSHWSLLRLLHLCFTFLVNITYPPLHHVTILRMPFILFTQTWLNSHTYHSLCERTEPYSLHYLEHIRCIAMCTPTSCTTYHAHSVMNVVGVTTTSMKVGRLFVLRRTALEFADYYKKNESVSLKTMMSSVARSP